MMFFFLGRLLPLLVPLVHGVGPVSGTKKNWVAAKF